jgi:hypothetical protein
MNFGTLDATLFREGFCRGDGMFSFELLTLGAASLKICSNNSTLSVKERFSPTFFPSSLVILDPSNANSFLSSRLSDMNRLETAWTVRFSIGGLTEQVHLLFDVYLQFREQQITGHELDRLRQGGKHDPRFTPHPDSQAVAGPIRQTDHMERDAIL